MQTDVIAPALEERYAGAKGLNIFMRSWLPAGPPRGVVVVVHGFNSHSGYYTWVAQQFVESELAVYALDLRGRGLSDGERYYVEDFADYVADVHLLVHKARERHPGLPIFMLGHSAGGVVACGFALDHQEELAGLVCESFAFQVPAPDFALAVLKGLSHLAPHAHVLRLKTEDFSRLPEVITAMKNDPLIENEVQPTRTVSEMVRADERLKGDFARITLPVLIMHGTADKVTRPEGSQFFFDTTGAPDKTLKLYDGHAHDLLNDIGKEIVMADITQWITERLTPRSA